MDLIGELKRDLERALKTIDEIEKLNKSEAETVEEYRKRLEKERENGRSGNL